MAGIGFSLKRLFQKKGVFNLVRAYGYAGLICAGPMILGVVLLVSIAFLSMLAGMSRHDRELLNCMLTYCLLASLTTTSLFNMPVTRYVEEKPDLETALEALLEGPQAEGLASFPEGTALLSAYIDDGVAHVDLSEAFRAVEEVDGLLSALQTAICLTANGLEPVYGADIYVEGEPYALHTLQVSAPIYVNEFK